MIEGKLTGVRAGNVLPLQRLAGNSVVTQLFKSGHVIPVQRQVGSDIQDPAIEERLEACPPVLSPKDPNQIGLICVREDGSVCEVKSSGSECRRSLDKSGGTGGTSSTLTMGSSGPAVVELQVALNGRNLPIAEDGVFTHETAGAVITFQAQNGLKPDGLVGAKTKAALGILDGGSLLSLGSSGPEVEELQRALNAVDTPIAEDGIFAHETRGAVITFQAQNDLTPDGLAGPKTKEALGLNQ